MQSCTTLHPMDKLSFIRSFTRKATDACRKKQVTRSAANGLHHAGFPVGYFVRNLILLAAEPRWAQKPPRLKRIKIVRLLQERSRFFLQVHQWLDGHNTGKPDNLSEGYGNQGGKDDDVSVDTYCIHCGGCCEIACGLPDFPADSILPTRWQRIFGEGLGEDHRFCPFLWEDRPSGGSLCSIHPWRSRPCRIFEAEECRFLLDDPEFKKLSDPVALKKVYRLLLRLIDAR